jgi:hypothetical protein
LPGRKTAREIVPRLVTRKRPLPKRFHLRNREVDQ